MSVLYIVLFLHQTTTELWVYGYMFRCISYYSYIKPQHRWRWRFLVAGCISYYSYIKPQPSPALSNPLSRCISYYSYIKPQQNASFPDSVICCISYYSYIKPQLDNCVSQDDTVVYRTIPTSNHNCTRNRTQRVKLYIVLFLHQTTTVW